VLIAYVYDARITAWINTCRKNTAIIVFKPANFTKMSESSTKSIIPFMAVGVVACVAFFPRPLSAAASVLMITQTMCNAEYAA
jgi:hypothetical protein